LKYNIILRFNWENYNVSICTDFPEKIIRFGIDIIVFIQIENWVNNILTFLKL